MLVLSRNPGEAIRIGEARVTIISVHGTRVRMGIEAPREVRVVREELVSAGGSGLGATPEVVPAA